jgi:glycosyltransferase involved in cell wall biosynthesis
MGSHDLARETISVVLPVFNGARFVSAAIESVLGQEHPQLELIVVDDGSTDETAAIARRYPVRYVYQRNQGPPLARNRGLAHTSGAIVSFCDADDMWAEDKLARQMPLLDRADVVIGYSQIMGTESDPFLLPSLNCALFRRQVFDRLGGFDPTLAYSDDLDWYMRAREADISMVLHRDVVLYHRRHRDNLTNNIQRRDEFQLLMLKKSLDRRRASGQLAQPLFSEFLDA